MIPLQHIKVPIMKLINYNLTNISKIHLKMNSCTKLNIEYVCVVFNKFCYGTLDIDLVKNTIKFDNLHVATNALLIFKCQHDNYYLNIMEHVDMNDITIKCTFQLYRNISVKPSLVAIESHYYLINVYSTVVITCEMEMASSEKESLP